MESSKDELFKLIQQKVKDGSIEALLKEIQKSLDLTLDLSSTSTSNLCLKDAEEVRDEYKTTFTLQDLAHYQAAIGINTIYFKIEEIPIPKNVGAFWRLVKEGK
ncbi:hypothetical protein [Aquiflexum sp.]|uniref:hypothetical protein n=1 Tax=Aquiflexum sp. TaxID=1872584 RepID=UPI003594538E